MNILNSLVVYYSKSGNTKGIAEIIASIMQTKSLSINLITKKGRGTKFEQEKEKILFNDALEASKKADIVIIGTPTYYQKASSMIARFINEVETKNVGLFCTYLKKVGITISGIEANLKKRGINVISSLKLEGLNRGKFEKLDKSSKDKYLKKINKFIRNIKI